MKRLEEPIPLTFEKAVETGFLKLDEIPYEDIIGLIDAMYACTISWLEGHSLAQTTLTCLYLHNIAEVKDKTMHAMGCAMLKLVDTILKQIVVVKVYEEEDFQYSSYGYDLCTSLSCNDVLNLLKNAEDELIKVQKRTEDPSEAILGVTARLKFTRFLLQVLVTLEPKMGSETTESEMNEITRLLNAAAELIPVLRRTTHLGTQADPDSASPCRIGFSLMVNQRFLPPTFPRFPKFRDRMSCITFLEDLVQRLKLASRVIHCTTYHGALKFFLDFSKRAGHCLLSRSVLQHLYFRDAPYSNKVFGRIPIDEMLRDSIRDFIAPAALNPDNEVYGDEVAHGCVKAFLFFHHTPFSSFLEICGYNRARQRDKLAKLLDAFGNLQEEAEKVDTYFSRSVRPEARTHQHMACFGTWVLYYTLRAMSLYLLSGLELELYSIHEYLYIFWYLYEFLFGWLVSSLTRADWYLENELSAKKTDKPKKGKDKKKKMRFHTVEIMYNQALQNMCGGYYKGIAGFLSENRIPQPLAKFNNERVRYEHRFAPFTDLSTPPPMPYEEYDRTVNQLLKARSQDLFLTAAKHFHQARTILETIPNPDQEMNDILKVAKFNYVVMNLLANGHKKDSKAPPEFDFSLHKYYPIIKQQ